MSRYVAVSLLLVAALSEAGGDWMVRVGMRATSSWQRAAWFVMGAAVLFAYGWTVNRPPWRFSELIGLYVVFFFLSAQAISYFLLKETLPRPVLIGGLLIVSGGLVIFLSK
jgi:small multidrug resistance family-3 protein